MGNFSSPDEVAEIERLSELGLPPITSQLALSAMLGVNPGLIWSLVNRPLRHYRQFTIPKGSGRRQIEAPRVALKIIQKWLANQFQRLFTAPDHVFGFVAGRSHIHAAKKHVAARWVHSVDIADFFPSTPVATVFDAARRLGYNDQSSKLIALLCCLRGHLAQGSPASPVISNIAFANVDEKLRAIAIRHELRVTRYADDIVFSGVGEAPDSLHAEIVESLNETPWRVSERKTEFTKTPGRLKVHGLLVHREVIRLTKGYRNKLRAFRHLLSADLVRDGDLARIRGHLIYGDQVLKVSQS